MHPIFGVVNHLSALIVLGSHQMVYRINGHALQRDICQQAEQGQTLSFIEESQPGDLAFFDNSEGSIVHVGLLLHNHKIIHAHGRVRIDAIDQTGIYNKSSKPIPINSE